MRQKKSGRYFPIFVLPTLIAFFLAFVIPFVMGLYLSLCEFTTVTNAKILDNPFGNYIAAFQDKDFLHAFVFTVGFAAVAIVTINVFAFGLAILLTRKIKGTYLFRTIFFMPNLIGGIILGYIWQSMINAVLYQYKTTLVANAKYGFIGLIILVNWQLIGYMMIIYIAGIQNVPTELIEAARIDGATSKQTLFKVTIPMIMPSITICLFLTISNTFKMFDQNLALTAGAPSKKTAMLALDIYSTFYDRVGQQGVGQAKAVLFFIIVAVIAFAQLMATRNKEVEQ